MSARLTLADRLLVLGDRCLRHLANGPDSTAHETDSNRRPMPQAPADESAADTPLTAREREISIRLMRVNHAGEVAAQALYQGQAATARDPEIRAHLTAAGLEERDHLEWCEQRLQELGGAHSALTPLWYLGSLAIGATAGVSGDRWSLGFVAETERQVEEHLSEHLARLPGNDGRSRAILEQMQADEVRHGDEAMAAGGSELPAPVRGIMRRVAKVMTRSAYWL